jgi:hypothetical protein
MSPSIQFNLPPALVEPLNRPVEPINRPSEKRFNSSTKLAKPVNLLRIVRTALDRCSLSNRWFAAVIGVSEQLSSSQLQDDRDDKHLSMRRMGRIDEVSFWREFLLLLAEDIGLCVVVLDEEQHAALTSLQNSSATFARVMSK